MGLPKGFDLMFIRLWRDFLRDPWQRRFALPLVIINLLGSVYGYYWYREQLAGTPFYAWPFVPDSPLSTTLFALALGASLAGVERVFLTIIACTASIKYGLWALAVISHFWWLGGAVTFVESMLWLSHLGMVVQGCIYLRTITPPPLPVTWR